MIEFLGGTVGDAEAFAAGTEGNVFGRTSELRRLCIANKLLQSPSFTSGLDHQNRGRLREGGGSEPQAAAVSSRLAPL